MAAWSLFSRDARATFRTALAIDDATWTRARVWALSVWVAVLLYDAETNPALSDIAHRAIEEILADHRTGACRDARNSGGEGIDDAEFADQVIDNCSMRHYHMIVR